MMIVACAILGYLKKQNHFHNTNDGNNQLQSKLQTLIFNFHFFFCYVLFSSFFCQSLDSVQRQTQQNEFFNWSQTTSSKALTLFRVVLYLWIPIGLWFLKTVLFLLQIVVFSFFCNCKRLNFFIKNRKQAKERK